jgi:hypothetical protein
MKTQIHWLKNAMSRIESKYIEAERCGGGLESHALGYARELNSELNQLRKLIEEVQPDVDAYIRYQQERLERACSPQQREINRATRVMLGDGKSRA